MLATLERCEWCEFAVLVGSSVDMREHMSWLHVTFVRQRHSDVAGLWGEVKVK